MSTLIGISFKAGNKLYTFSKESDFPSASEWNNKSNNDCFGLKMDALLKTFIHEYKKNNKIVDDTEPNSVSYALHFDKS